MNFLKLFCDLNNLSKCKMEINKQKNQTRKLIINLPFASSLTLDKFQNKNLFLLKILLLRVLRIFIGDIENYKKN